jgi:excinuclease ABC subunit B
MMARMDSFKLYSDFAPAGDQPEAIAKLVGGVERGGMQTLLGVTGSGKTYTVANVIAKTNRSTLVISHNKTLAAQLYSEFKNFFPKNKVSYFVSYYDYYQPESYIPQTDTYIEKDAQVNEKIERMRLAATANLLTPGPTIIVATVSCIYGLGSPQEWNEMAFLIAPGMKIARSSMLAKFVSMQYERNDLELKPGAFRAKGDTVEIIPGYSTEVVRISLYGDEVESVSIHHPQTMEVVEKPPAVRIFPARHYVIPESEKERALKDIRIELEQRLPELEMLEAHRLRTRTNYDLELIEELGFCSGIENYSRHFDGRQPGQPPYSLMDFLPRDGLIVIDESHVTIPQLHGMYHGDRTRKKNLIDYGFRLPSAYDNRPLQFEEFEKHLKNVIFVSATPSDYERRVSGQIVEQLVRPTGLVDPQVIVRKSEGQVKDLIVEVKARAAKNERVLVTTLTKRMAEDLTEFLANEEIRVRYLHSEIETLQRTELIRQLRLGEFDCLVGINLLREGLDIPEVSLVAILDADKEGFLRNDTSLIQTIGRAARNSNGTVILYADRMTGGMQTAISETERRRGVQIEFNKLHGITPRTIHKAIGERVVELREKKHMAKADLQKVAIELEAKMRKAAEELEFEDAIKFREQLNDVRRAMLEKEKAKIK